MKTQIQLPVSELKTILPGFSKVIHKHPTLPVLGSVRVERNEQGEVSLQATNLEDYVRVRLHSSAGPETAVLVPFEALAKASKGAAKDSVLMLRQEKSETILRTYLGNNPIDQKLEAPEVQEWPSLPPPKDYGILLEAGFSEVFLEALACASHDPSRLMLQGVYLDVSDPQTHYVVATNGRILFAADSLHFDLKESLLIPNRRFLGWHGFWEKGPFTLATLPGRDSGPGWVQLQSERWTFLTRAMEGEYPQWKQVVPHDRPHSVIQLDTEAIHALKEVVPKLPGAQNENAAITLLLDQHHLGVGGRSFPSENLTTIPIESARVTGEPVAVNLNREYLLQALRFGFSELDITSPAAPILCPAGGKQLVIAALAPDTPTINHNEERNDMKRDNGETETQTPAPETAIRTAMQQIEKLKETLRGVISDFNDVLAVLKTAEKEHKVTEKEIESVRTTLRTIQSVRI